MNNRLAQTATLLVLSAAALIGNPASAETLYQRLGELPAIECWIDASLKIIDKDKRINDFFCGRAKRGAATKPA